MITCFDVDYPRRTEAAASGRHGTGTDATVAATRDDSLDMRFAVITETLYSRPLLFHSSRGFCRLIRESRREQEMSVQWRSRLAVAAVALLAAAIVTTSSGAVRASASSCENWTGMQPPSPGHQSGLSGVIAVSPCNAWAVGSSLNASAEQPLSLAEHWDGAAWNVVPTPSPAAPRRP
jgi:hypothetical protein